MSLQKMLSIIHFLLTLSLPTFIFLIGGCRETDTGNPLDFGREVDIQQIQAAISVATQDTDPSSMRVGQYVHFADTQEIAGAVQTITADTAQTIISREEEPDRIIFTMVERKATYTGNNVEKTSSESKFAVKKRLSMALQNANAEFYSLGETPLRTVLREISSKDTPQLAAAASPPPEPPVAKVSYHNLQVSSRIIPVPDLVQAQPNCLGIKNCQVQVTELSFDKVFWDSETSAQKVHFEYKFSDEVPFLASLLDKCTTLLVNIGGTKTLARLCSPVLDFRFESDAAKEMQ